VGHVELDQLLLLAVDAVSWLQQDTVQDDALLPVDQLDQADTLLFVDVVVRRLFLATAAAAEIDVKRGG
jgi:hypothetical protein